MLISIKDHNIKDSLPVHKQKHYNYIHQSLPILTMQQLSDKPMLERIKVKLVMKLVPLDVISLITTIKIHNRNKHPRMENKFFKNLHNNP